MVDQGVSFVLCLYSNCIFGLSCICLVPNHCIICPVKQGDNDHFVNHNGEFTGKKCVRERLDWIRFLPPSPSLILYLQKKRRRLYLRKMYFFSMCQFCWTPLFLQLAISENWNWINLEIQQQINLYNIPILNIQKTWYHDTRCEICHFCFQSDLQMNPLWASKNWTASAEWYNYCSDVNYTRNCVWNIYDQNQGSVEGRVSGNPKCVQAPPNKRCSLRSLFYLVIIIIIFIIVIIIINILIIFFLGLTKVPTKPPRATFEGMKKDRLQVFVFVCVIANIKRRWHIPRTMSA